MSPTPAAPQLLHLTSRDYTGRDKTAALREFYGRELMRVELRPYEGAGATQDGLDFASTMLPLGGDSHLGLAFAHRARRHRYRVIDPDEAGGVAIEALHRDNAQETGLFIQHGERSPRRADDIAHRADDGARRVFETKRLTQDLVEGVKEVDLLVAGGQLFGEVGGLPVGP